VIDNEITDIDHLINAGSKKDLLQKRLHILLRWLCFMLVKNENRMHSSTEEVIDL